MTPAVNPKASAVLVAALVVLTGFAGAAAEPLAVNSPAPVGGTGFPAGSTAPDGLATTTGGRGPDPVQVRTVLLAWTITATPSGHRHTAFLGDLPAYEVEDLAAPDLERFHVYVGGMRLAVVERAGAAVSTQYPFADPLGSTRLAATHDPAQSPPHPVAYEAAWQPFGVEVPLSGQAEEKYLGKKAPEEDGLYWFGARQYDPETGRFQGLDPIHGVAAFPQTLNRYAYATNDPVGNADPNGMCELVCLAIILVAIGLTLGVTATVVPEVGAVLDPVMLALGFIPFVGDFLSDPYFAARSVTECALGRCDAANLGSDLAFLFLPGGPLSNVAHGRRLLSATTGGLFGAGRMGNRADDLTYLARAGTRDNYRRMLVGFTGVDTGDAFQPHHVFPQKFERYPSPP